MASDTNKSVHSVENTDVIEQGHSGEQTAEAVTLEGENTLAATDGDVTSTSPSAEIATASTTPESGAHGEAEESATPVPGEHGEVEASTTPESTSTEIVIAESVASTLTVAPLSEPAEGEKPLVRVKFGFQILFALANTVFWLTIIPIQTLLLPKQVELIAGNQKESMLALLLSATGISSIVAQPLAGALSDRTSSRFGRRRPWIVFGLLFTIVSMVLLANAQSIAALAGLCALWGFVLGFIQSPLLAIIPDRVPVKQRAVVSAFAGLAQPLGILIGTILIAEVIKNVQNSYYVITAILTVVLVLFVLLTPEKPLSKERVPAFSLKSFLASFFSPLKSSDFTYTWAARFFIILAQIILAQYLLYYLRDVIKYESLFPGQTAEQGFAMYQGIQTVALIISTIVAGIISDKIQRRKPFVIVASIIMTVALLLIAFVPQWPVVLLVAVIFGIGFGVYISADIALATQVLPKAESQGKDLGFIATANILPQLLFPIFVTLAFSVFNGYPALFAIGAISTVIGAVLIVPIKGVR